MDERNIVSEVRQVLRENTGSGGSAEGNLCTGRCEACEACEAWGRYKPGACDRISDMSNSGDDSFDVEFETLDDSGLNVWLETGPKFGCVQFRPKKS